MSENGVKKGVEQCDKIALLKMHVALAYFQALKAFFDKNTFIN